MTGPTLTSPFKNTQQLEKGGKSFTYIPASEVVNRLNAVLGVGGWSFECREVSQPDAKFLVVHGRLTACGGTFEQYGGHPVHNNTDAGDNWKSAASDAMKKCAAMIGIGLYLALKRTPDFLGVPTISAGSVPVPPTSAGPADPPAQTQASNRKEAAPEASIQSDVNGAAPSEGSIGAGAEGGGEPERERPPSRPDAMEKLQGKGLADRLAELPLETKAKFLAAKRRVGLKDGDADFMTKASQLLDQVLKEAV